MGLTSVLRSGLASAALSSSLGAQAAPVVPGDDLVGLWGSETTFGPQVHGAITLERVGHRWTIRVAGFEASALVVGDSIRMALPGGQGELRARLDRASGGVRGFWVQPGGSLAPYATPVRFSRSRDGAWIGTVEPVSNRFSLYLQVQRQEDGSLKGVLRNPEMNWTGRAPWFRLAREGDNIAFIDPVSGKKRLTQTYDSAQRQIGFDFDGPVILRPRQPEQAVGFFPRSPSAAPYEYRAPVPRGDGWETARAASVGLDEGQLQSLVRRIVATDPATDSAPLIHSLLIARRGKLVLDEYFFGAGPDIPHDLRSASKTFTSVMAGVAMDRGARFTMSTPVISLFPSVAASSDDRKARITVGHLLTHSTGLSCDDNDEKSPGNENTMQGQNNEPDWYRYILNLPMAHDPGSTYAYCSGGMNLAGGVIANATRTWLPDFFDRYIARPLQIDHFGMNLMPSGEGYSGGGVRMRSRDLLKFGQLYLNGGIWNGTRVVSKDWVTRSTAQQISAPNGGSDGYAWHRYSLTVGGKTYQEYEANGNGGQFLIVVPELDLAVVFTAGNYRQYRIWRKFRDELVPRYIMAAATRD
jgi:CubicO group peptidase (beta-lactamase class C family)